MSSELNSREIDKLTPEQQTEVMHLAARLQSESADLLTPAQLAKIASEAGIEERFVHEAISRIKATALQTQTETPIETTEKASPPFRAVALIFAVIQFWAAFVSVNLDFYQSVAKGQPLFLTGFLAFMLGWFSALDNQGRRRGFGLIIGSAVLGLAIAGLFHIGFIGYPLNPKWFTCAAIGLPVQLVAYRFGRILKFIHRASPKKPAPSAPGSVR